MKYSAMLVKGGEAVYNPNVSLFLWEEAAEATTETGLMRSSLILKTSHLLFFKCS